MLPTRADSVAKTALPDRGNRGSTCFMISAGPIAFNAKARARLAASSCRQLFSGPWRSSWRNPVASITRRSSPRSAANAAARARLSSSKRSIAGEVLRLNETTCLNFPAGWTASTNAPPIPPPAPNTTATPARGNDPRSTLSAVSSSGSICPVTSAWLRVWQPEAPELARRNGRWTGEPEEKSCSPTPGQSGLRAGTRHVLPSAIWANESKLRRMRPRRKEHAHRLREHGSASLRALG